MDFIYVIYLGIALGLFVIVCLLATMIVALKLRIDDVERNLYRTRE